jgi:hypothetical protein
MPMVQIYYYYYYYYCFFVVIIIFGWNEIEFLATAAADVPIASASVGRSIGRNGNWQRNTEVLVEGGYLLQCYFAHHKSHTDCAGIEFITGKLVEFLRLSTCYAVDRSVFRKSRIVPLAQTENTICATVFCLFYK